MGDILKLRSGTLHWQHPHTHPHASTHAHTRTHTQTTADPSRLSADGADRVLGHPWSSPHGLTICSQATNDV